MICYKDKTFCDEYETCTDGEICDRALTEQVILDAIEWWGQDSQDGPPISVYTDKPECWKGAGS